MAKFRAGAGSLNAQQHTAVDEKLARGCARLDLDLSAGQRAQLLAHLKLLAKWNRRFNLTAITELEQMVVLHALDSLAIAKFIAGRNLLDVGSGGGFPGVPLAIALPRLQVTLLDSRGRRVRFLRNAVGELGLANVQVVQSRVETYRPPLKFDTVAARAFAALDHTLQVTDGVLARGGRLLAMKGKTPRAEIAELQPNLRASIRVEKLRVPFLPAARSLIIIEY